MRAATSAWRALLALEHEAIWWYQSAAGRPALARQAVGELARHRTERDRLLDAPPDERAEQPGPSAGYVLPERTDAAFRAHSADLEQRLCAAQVTLVGFLDVTDRGRATTIAELRASARSALAWGAPPVPFPGLGPDR